jgi:hypothetical protein
MQRSRGKSSGRADDALVAACFERARAVVRRRVAMLLGPA